MRTMYNFHGDNEINDVKPTTKKLALEIGFDSLNSFTLASSVSELIQSVSALGQNFNVSMRGISTNRNRGIEFIINAITDNSIKTNFSINGRLGSGFENIKRKMDDFCISSSGGELKLVTRKWIPIS